MTTSHSITEGGGQATERACGEQKALDWPWLSLQHFGDKICQNRAMATRKTCQEAFSLAWCCISLERQRHQTQAGSPTLQPRFETGHSLRRERRGKRLLKKILRLLLR